MSFLRKLANPLLQSVCGTGPLSCRHLRSIPADRLKKLIADQDDNMSNLIVPGRDRTSTWFLPQPRDPSKKVVGLQPVKPLPKLRISLVREGCTNRPFYTIQVGLLPNMALVSLFLSRVRSNPSLDCR